MGTGRPPPPSPPPSTSPSPGRSCGPSWSLRGLVGPGPRLSAISLTTKEAMERARRREAVGALDYEAGQFAGLTTFHGLVRLYQADWRAKVASLC